MLSDFLYPPDDDDDDGPDPVPEGCDLVIICLLFMIMLCFFGFFAGALLWMFVESLTW